MKKKWQITCTCFSDHGDDKGEIYVSYYDFVVAENEEEAKHYAEEIAKVNGYDKVSFFQMPGHNPVVSTGVATEKDISDFKTYCLKNGINIKNDEEEQGEDFDSLSENVHLNQLNQILQNNSEVSLKLQSFYVKGFYKKDNEKKEFNRRIVATYKGEAIVQFEKFYNSFHFYNIEAFSDEDLKTIQNFYKKSEKDELDSFYNLLEDDPVEAKKHLINLDMIVSVLKDAYGEYVDSIRMSDEEYSDLRNKAERNILFKGLDLVDEKKYEEAKTVFDNLDEQYNPKFYYDYINKIQKEDEICKFYESKEYEDSLDLIDSLISFYEKNRNNEFINVEFKLQYFKDLYEEYKGEDLPSRY